MTFVVTGASRGIGAEIVRSAVRGGHSAAFTYLANEQAAEALVASLRTEGAQSVSGHKVDVRDPAAVEGFAKDVERSFGRIEVVVCNAGINRNAPVIGMSDADWREVLETNLYGAFYTARAFLPVLLAQRFGRIVFVSSLSQSGMTGQANYAASKAGLVGLARTIAKEYGSRGITSNVVAPGIIDTDMTRDHAGGRFQQFWTANSPLKRNGNTEEVAEVVMFLARREASYVNGACIPVTSGLDWVP